MKKLKGKQKTLKKKRKSNKIDLDDAAGKLSPEKAGVKKKQKDKRIKEKMTKSVQAAVSSGAMEVDGAKAVPAAGVKGKRKRKHKSAKSTAELLARIDRERQPIKPHNTDLIKQYGAKLTFSNFLREFCVSEGGCTAEETEAIVGAVVDLTEDSPPTAVKRLISYAQHAGVPLSRPDVGAAPNGTPVAAIVCASFQRVIDCAKEAEGSGIKTMKLFAKHKKMAQQAYDLGRSSIDLAVGTPQRLRLLAVSGHLQLPTTGAFLLAVDHAFRDVKQRRAFDDAFMRMEIGRLVLEMAKLRAVNAPKQPFKVLLL